MSKKIKFTAVTDYAWELADRPYPAKGNVPKWWKDMPPYIESDINPTGKKFRINFFKGNGTPKKCMPMYDAMTSGYIIPLWADVEVRSISNDVYHPQIFWKTDREVFEANLEGSQYLNYPVGYSEILFKYLNVWCMQTPKGYSVRIESPVGHNDLPFKCLDAVVDTDKYDAALPTPVFVKHGFEGLVRKGTPIIQVTPFKRENWEAEFDYYKDQEFYLKQEKYLKVNSHNNYVQTQWSKKFYK